MAAAAAPLRASPPAPTTAPRRAGRRTPLRLVAPLRRPRHSYGDVLFATTLSALLGLGIFGVLLFNTAMQTQADRIAAMRQALATTAVQVQSAQTTVDRENAPSELAASAAALRMHPARVMPVLRPTARPPRRLPAAPRVSARGRAARTVRGG